MNAPTLNDKKLGISAANYNISIRANGRIFTIHEMTLKQFEAFYSYWCLAFQVIDRTDSFIDAFTNNVEFKFYLERMFSVVGIDVENLTINQIRALVLTYSWEDGNQQSIIFRVHSTYPKYPTQGTKTPLNLKDFLSFLLSKLQKTMPCSWEEYTLLKKCQSEIYSLQSVLEKLPDCLETKKS